MSEVSQVIESSIEQSARRLVERHGGMLLKLRPETGARGFPDRTLLIGGRIVFIEFKQMKGRLSPHQRWWLDELTRMGFETAIVRSTEEMKGLLDAGEN